MLEIIPIPVIENKIYVIREHKIMLDSDLAELYGVQTKVLNQSVKRNIDRFPHNFMFQLTNEEFLNLKSQFVTSSWGGKRKLPYAFTEHGVLMLSSVLNSEKAVQVNIQIIRVFNKLKKLTFEPIQEISELKRRLLLYMETNDHRINDIIQVLNNLLESPYDETKQIGFKVD